MSVQIPFGSRSVSVRVEIRYVSIMGLQIEVVTVGLFVSPFSSESFQNTVTCTNIFGIKFYIILLSYKVKIKYLFH